MYVYVCGKGGGGGGGGWVKDSEIGKRMDERETEIERIQKLSYHEENVDRRF